MYSSEKMPSEYFFISSFSLEEKKNQIYFILELPGYPGIRHATQPSLQAAVARLNELIRLCIQPA